MIEDDKEKGEQARSAVIEPQPGRYLGAGGDADGSADEKGWVIETVVCPFHCLYQDALSFHTQSRLARSESEASRIVASGTVALCVECGGPGSSSRHRVGPARAAGDRSSIPDRPLSLFEAWRLLPAIAAEPGTLVPPV